MAESLKTVFVDDEVASKVLDIIRDAQKYVILVTPFLGLWGHAQDAIRLAVNRGIKVTAIIRHEGGTIDNGAVDDVTWFLNSGVEVLAAEYLHAKIYLNEHAVVVSSMNLTEFSTKNSLEIALQVQDKGPQQLIRDYVSKTLMPLAINLRAGLAEPPRSPVRGPAPVYAAPSGAAGVCIRCQRPIALDASRPLCPVCYEVWAAYRNEDFSEQFCHVCGQPSDTCYARPLCRDCYRRYR
jgi:hypothetical protein